MLYNGENVGGGSGAIGDVPADPLDGTRLAALGMNNVAAAGKYWLRMTRGRDAVPTPVGT